MTEAKNVKKQFFVTKIYKILDFARFSLLNALLSEKRLNLRTCNLCNCLVIRVSLFNVLLRAPPQNKIVSIHTSACNEDVYCLNIINV